MFETAKGSWPFTRAAYAAYAECPELDVRGMPIEAICVHTYSTVSAAHSDGGRYLIIHHDPGAAAEEVRAAVQQAVRSNVVSATGCSQFDEGFIAAVKR